MYRFLFVVLWAAVSAVPDPMANIYSHNRVVVCYVAGWAAYRPMKGAYTWDNVDPTQCSHIIYAFAGLDNETFTMKSLDPFLDLEDGGGRAQYKKMNSYKEKYPALKVSLALGGWNEGSEKYSTMAMNPESRKKFVQQAVALIRKHNFDGLDMDWEYPGSRNGRIEDKENFVTLLKELRQELTKDKLLTVAVGAAPSTAKIGYNIPEISKYVDYIHLMCYDYHGSWDQQTGHNAPLHLPEGTQLEEDHRFSVEDTVRFYTKMGAPRQKLVLGMPFYGRTFNLEDSSLRDVGARSNGSGFQGPYTRENGFLGYNEICKELATQEWTELWDDAAQVPYMVNGDRWVSYDNERSIAEKAKYAYSEGLAGAMIWAIDNDDFQNECSGGRYPLLRTVNSVFKAATQEDAKTSTQRPKQSSASTVSLCLALAWLSFIAVILH